MYRFVSLRLALVMILVALAAIAPGRAASAAPGGLNVVATTTFLADMAQKVAGSRTTVRSLVPIGVDPHEFEPTPADIRTIADANLLIVNGLGLEGPTERLLKNAGGAAVTIEATSGISLREPAEGEPVDEDSDGHAHEVDPHCWLDPVLAITYVQNIRDALSQVDPDGAATYAANADAYITQLWDLDAWVSDQVSQLPPERRLLVTNHESFGYYADRYGFRVVGAIIPSVGTGASPSARDLAALVAQIRNTGAPAIFLETGTNPRLADQVASEAGVKVEVGLHSHSVTEPGGPAPTYIDMIRYNTTAIVNALR